MNRAERRRAAKKKTPEQIDINTALKLIRQESNRAKIKTTDVLYWAALWTLHNKFGYGRKRLDRFRLEYLKTVDAFHSGHLKEEDIIEALTGESYRGKMTTEETILEKAGMTLED